jgi:DNA-directed RNA polymerase subunit RPC12/RpoP
MSAEMSGTATAHPWSKDAFLVKAQRYAEVLAANPRDDWKFPFWASLTLELVARAALAYISPTLLAEKSDWNNIYFALGKEPTASKFVPKSITFAEVVTRLEAILPEFTPEMRNFSVSQMSRRNEELHSGSLPFEGMGTGGWLPTYYLVLKTLLESIEESLSYLFGEDEAVAAQTMIDALRDETRKAVRQTIAAHRTVWEQKQREGQESLAAEALAWASRHSGHRVECPACGSKALVTGSAVRPAIKQMNGDVITEKQDFLPAKFECVACGLKISGFSHLNASGLGDTFTATFTYEVSDLFPESEDEYPEYEPDYND